MNRRTSGLGILGGRQDQDKTAGTAAGKDLTGTRNLPDARRGVVRETNRRSAKISAAVAGRVGMLSPLHGSSALQQQLQGVQDGALHLAGGLANPDILKHLSVQDIRDLRLVFDAFDADSSGYIDERELRRAFRSLGFKVSCPPGWLHNRLKLPVDQASMLHDQISIST